MCLAARDIGEAAVDRARDICRAVDLDLVGSAVLLLIGCRRRARASRPATVYVRVRATGDGDRVLCRRVACFRVAAPSACDAAFRDGRRRRRVCKLIAFIGDLFVVCRFLQDEFFVVTRLDAAVLTICNRDAAWRVLKQHAFASVLAVHVEVVETFDRRSAAIIQGQEGNELIHMRIEVEVDLGEISDIGCCRIAGDVQLIACTVVIPVGGSAATVDNAGDASAEGGVCTADIDNVARRVAARRTSAIHVAHRAARDIDDVACRIAACRETAVDIVACCGAALDVDSVLYGIPARSNAAINIAAQRAARERGGIVRGFAHAAGIAAVDGSCRAATDFGGVSIGVTALRAAAVDVLRRAACNFGSIALGVAALRAAAIDVFCCATCNSGGIARYLARAIGVSAVDLACARDGAAFDGRCIADDVAICSAHGHAAVDVRMCRTAFEGRRIALDDSSPVCSRHAAGHIVVEMVAVAYGMIVLDASAALGSTAVYAFNG